MSLCAHCATPLPDGSFFCSYCGTPTSAGESTESTTLTPQGREIFDRLKAATAGRYEVVRELGRGGMAVVFLGFQKSLDRPIAIKVLLPILGYDAEVVERFQREARTQGKLDHPSIISVYEVYHQGGLTFFTMPYITGQSLRAHLVVQPQPRLHKVQRYLRQAAEALAYAHRRGVVHRDVKPDNILLDPERDSVILTDFGIAKALAAETTLTTPGDLLGTPQYMSPEQGEAKSDLDGRTDQYSLGLIGYEMLAGVRPFTADNLAELMYKHRFEEPENLDALRPDAPAALRDAVNRAIRKDRDERFPTMEAFLAAIAGPDWLEPDTGPLTSRPSTSTAAEQTTIRVATPSAHARAGAEPTASGGGRSRVVVAAGTVAALAALVTALWLFTPLREWVGAGPGDGVALVDSEDAGGTGVAEGGEGANPSETGDAASRGALVVEDVDAASGDVAPVGELAGAGAPDRSRVISARAEARQARDAAVAAGAGEVGDGRLADLDDRLGAASASLDAGRLEQALTAFAGLRQEYEALAADASRQMTTAAVGARDSAAALRTAALAVAADSLFPQELSALDAERDRGLGALNAGRASEAVGPLERAAAGYSSLAERAIGALRQSTAEARDEMEAAREAAVQAGGLQRTPKRMTLADGLRTQALESLSAERHVEALILMAQATEAYTTVTGLIERPGAGDRPATGAASPEQSVRDLIEVFRQAFEAEDVQRLRTEVYGGAIPRDDAAYFRIIFERADELQAQANIRDLVAGESTARAHLELSLQFRQARTRQPQETTENLQLQFRHGADGWRLQGLRRR